MPYPTWYVHVDYSANEHGLRLTIAIEKNYIGTGGFFNRFKVSKIAVYICIGIVYWAAALHFLPNRANTFNVFKLLDNFYLPVVIFACVAIHQYLSNIKIGLFLHTIEPINL
jgi:hypothetical protein